ncbi:MAG: NfeD family protein [Candidatus Acidiferrales bacterium]
MRKFLPLFAVGAFLLSASTAAAGTVVEIRLQDEIVHSITAEYLVDGIEHAEKINADAVLIWLHTPGGLETSMREMVDRITASKVPVIVYVAPTGSRAASAGFFILLAADVAVMASGTTTGASSPVAFGGGQIDETLRKKITNDAAAYLRSFASKRHRNPEVAQLAVTEAKSFTEQEALEAKLIDAVYESREQIFEQFRGRAILRFDGRTQTLALADVRVEPWEMTQRQRFLSRLVDPNIAFLLLVFGILGLYIEFNHPGFILAGVTGGICLVLALFALHLLPVNYAAVLLIVLSVALFILEAFYASHGVLAAGGIVAMVLGAMMLIESPPIPELQVRWQLALAVAVPFAVITVLLLRLVLRSRKWRAGVGQGSLLGARGEVRQEIPEGRKGLVFVSGELWTATAARPLRLGESVRVVGVNGLVLHVEPVEGTAATLVSPQKE